MSWRRARSSVGVVVVGLALSLAPVMTTSAHATTKHKPAKVSSVGTCKALSGEQTQSSKLSTTLEKAFASGNFASIKAAVLASFGQLGSAVNAEKSLLGSAPANVKAAFTTIAGVFAGLRSQIAASTSLAQLEGAFTSIGTNPKLTAASKILANYYGSKCGTVTPTA
jgi:hypothetical protein